MAALHKLLTSRNVMFTHNHGRPMTCGGTAQLLSNTLYYKRFFPYYTFNLCAGLDEQGARLRTYAVFRHAGIPHSFDRSGLFFMCLSEGLVSLVGAMVGKPRLPCRPVASSLIFLVGTLRTPPLTAGRGAVYTYDAIGSYERTGYSCQGSGKDLMQPVLDNQLKAASPLLVPARVRRDGWVPAAVTPR